jgi:cell division septum initiation protein DivIVA
MRALSEENDRLKAQLATAEQRISELSRAAVSDQTTLIPPSPPAEPEKPAKAPVPPELPALTEREPANATGMLALAQKLHDEYVRAGQEEGDQILNDAKSKAAGIVREAEEASQRTLSKLEQDRTVLERKIDELRIFERDYRTRLKAYLESLLSDIDGKAVSGPGSAGWDLPRSDSQRPGSQLGG